MKNDIDLFLANTKIALLMNFEIYEDERNVHAIVNFQHRGTVGRRPSNTQMPMIVTED